MALAQLSALLDAGKLGSVKDLRALLDHGDGHLTGDIIDAYMNYAIDVSNDALSVCRAGILPDIQPAVVYIPTWAAVGSGGLASAATSAVLRAAAKIVLVLPSSSPTDRQIRRAPEMP